MWRCNRLGGLPDEEAARADTGESTERENAAQSDPLAEAQALEAQADAIFAAHLATQDDAARPCEGQSDRPREGDFTRALTRLDTRPKDLTTFATHRAAGDAP